MTCIFNLKLKKQNWFSFYSGTKLNIIGLSKDQTVATTFIMVSLYKIKLNQNIYTYLYLMNKLERFS